MLNVPMIAITEAADESATAQEIASHLPSRLDNQRIKEIADSLDKINSFSLMLQKENRTNLAHVRALLDLLIENFGDAFKYYLSPTA
ncbi:hypothetical protein PsorP6_001106 [Peronosclerospora sorghi]|uniref:Uncharacterized protein n=1 Tax=Peronosclerospora sorghi TaxID=230839 RepID=A0ACC0WSY0_9STRA|nr:hypothetical protein PsorP6_001106 [Peronosclerospora sorghi]